MSIKSYTTIDPRVNIGAGWERALDEIDKLRRELDEAQTETMGAGRRVMELEQEVKALRYDLERAEAAAQHWLDEVEEFKLNELAELEAARFELEELRAEVEEYRATDKRRVA